MRDQKRNHQRNQQPDTIFIAVWDFEHQGGLSGMSRILPWCTIGLIPTKTLVICNQFLGSSFSLLSTFFHVSRTTFCLRALLLYLLLVVDRSKVSLAFIMASHQLWISASCGHSSSGLFLLTLLHLSFHTKWV